MLAAESQREVSTHDNQLRTAISHFQANPLLLRAYSQQQLISRGIDLIDETGDCPLCDTSWEAGKLAEYLKQKLSSANVANEYQKLITQSTAALTKYIATTQSSLKRLLAATELVGLDEILTSLKAWQHDLNRLANTLDNAIESYLASGFNSESIKVLLAPKKISQHTSLLAAEVKAKFPEATPEQTAWDTLTRLEENLSALENAEAEHKSAKESLQRASILLDSFQQARDSVLRQIYDSIKDRFVSLYKGLHGIDEAEFDAIIEPDGAALNLEVGFYGRGVHPPHALHSEGHQDSMGLCLYLALAEKLTEGLIDLVILDDVVMSVDADHRRELCRLLVHEFPNRQFLITTHDKTWATQLKTEGVVTSKSLVEFFNWNINTGPQVNNEVAVWERIEKDMQANDVPGAAGKLRRASEQFFGMVCDSLQAPVRFRLDGRTELGDLLPASIGQLRNFLKKAKTAANSWNDKEAVNSLSELDSTVGQMYQRTNAEQWAVNASVHYNNWATLSPKDFSPVIEAFQDLFALFHCSSCGGMLYVVNAGPLADSVKCSCGKVNWNMIPKSRN